MRLKQLSLLLFMLFGVMALQAGVMTLKGVYQGKNLFIQNPYTGGEFCTVSVFVNNKKILSYPKVSAFEVDMSYLAMNTPVTIKILHKKNCAPRVLNKQVIKSSSRFAYTSFNVDSDALNWSTKGETEGGRFIIQRLNPSSIWEDVDVFDGKGSPTANYYTVKSDHNTGVNKYRIKCIEKSGLIFYTATVSFQLNRSPITFYPRRVSDVINFVAKKPIRYIIYDKNGNKLKQGKALTVDCSELPGDDHYTLVFDNQKKSFYKKKN